MKWLSNSLLATLMFIVSSSNADDIEIYLNEDEVGAPYVLLMLDLRSSTFNTLCRYSQGQGQTSSCAPPFMSQDAYDKLTEYGMLNYPDTGGFTNRQAVSTFEVFRAVLAGVLADPLFDPIYMALQTSNWTAKEGGTILKGYTQLGNTDPGEGRTELLLKMSQMPGSMGGSDAHEFSPKPNYYEWWRYVNSLGSFDQSKRTIIWHKDNNRNFLDANEPSYDRNILTPVDGDKYVSPFVADDCPKLYSIMVAMQGPPEGNNTAADDYIEVDFSPEAVAKTENTMQYMHNPTTDLLEEVGGIQPMEKSWIISDDGSIGQTRNLALAGNTDAPLSLSDPAELEELLRSVLTEILSVSSTFVAASVPVNVFNQAETLDNLFIALFEAQSSVDWPGNLKKLKLLDTFDAADPNDPNGTDGVFDTIVDQNDDPAFETGGSNAGRIKFNALTYWTDPDALPDPNSIVTDPNNPAYVPDGVDGRVVDRGAGGQKIPGFITGTEATVGYTDTIAETNAGGDRKLYVEPATVVNGATNGTTLVDFDYDEDVNLWQLLDANDPSLGSTEAADLIRWGRGLDVFDEDADATTTVRRWILGDAIHSRPFALNYGKAGGYTNEQYPNIRILMGTGDGIFHMIENTSSTGDQTGREVWGFLPRESLGQIKLRQQGIQPSAKMTYGVDGAPVVFTNDVDSDGNLVSGDGDEAYVYFGMRRGGYGYYALDISDVTATKPELAWKIDPTTVENTATPFSKLGLTFSTPVVGKVNYDGTSVDVLIFGGGYNGGWDSGYTTQVGDDVNADDDTVVGNAVYIVNARTGSLIWKTEGGATATTSNTAYVNTDMKNSIPSELTAIENLNGNIVRLYVGDTGGAVWRIDLPEGNVDDTDHRKDNWFSTKFAQLATANASFGTTNERRFFHGPDIVETFDSTGDFDGIVITSGNRADPTETGVTNFAYYLKDRIITADKASLTARAPLTPASLSDQTLCIDGDEVACTADLTKRDAAGWMRRLAQPGEKGLASPLVDAGRVFFTSYYPSAGVACAPSEGNGKVYVVNLKDGSKVFNNLSYEIGPGIPPSPVLIGDVILIPGGGFDPDGDGGDGTITKLPQSLTQKLYRIYWREPGIDQL